MEEDKHGRMHLLNPLTSEKRSLPMLLDMRNFHVSELGQEHFFQLDVCVSITKKVAFMRLSSESDEFVLVTLARGKMAFLFLSRNMRNGQ
jgi:uncharacterized membrane protein